MAQIKVNVAYGATGTLATANIADLSVTTAKIAADAVTDAKVADDVIGTEHLTAGEVDTTALGADSVTAAKIGDNVLDSEHYAAASIDNEHLADNAADTAEIADNAITLAKMAGLARGKLIYGDSSGDPAALAVGSADEVLTHDGTDLSWASVGGGITAASQFRITSNFTGDAEPMVNWEVGDTDGYGTLGSAMTESSGLFTFPSTGYWLITLFIKDQNDVDDPYASYDILSTTNNSSYGTAAGISLGYSGGHYGSASCEFLFDVTSTTNCKVRFDAANRNASNTVGSSSSYNATYATFIRLGDT